jgi:hypothetical protein
MDDDEAAKPKKNPVLTAEEMAQRAEESGFGPKKDEPAPEPVMEPLAGEGTPHTAEKTG